MFKMNLKILLLLLIIKTYILKINLNNKRLNNKRNGKIIKYGHIILKELMFFNIELV